MPVDGLSLCKAVMNDSLIINGLIIGLAVVCRQNKCSLGDWFRSLFLKATIIHSITAWRDVCRENEFYIYGCTLQKVIMTTTNVKYLMIKNRIIGLIINCCKGLSVWL